MSLGHRRGMAAFRAGRMDEWVGAVRGATTWIDWTQVDAALPPPQAVNPLAVTWTGAVDGLSTAARLLSVSRFGDALQYLRASQRLAQSASPLGRGLILAAEGRCLHLLGDGEAALGMAEAALGLLVLEGDDLLTAEASLQTLRTRGQVQHEAIIPADLHRAWTVFESSGDRVGGADCLLEQGTRELRSGHPDHALRSFDRASEILGDAERGWSVVACEIAVARCIATARTSGAREAARSAKRSRAELFVIDDPWWGWQMDCAVGEAAQASGDRRLAGRATGASVAALERLRFRVGDTSQRAGFLVPRLRPFELALEQALADDDCESGLVTLERVKRSALAHTLLARATQADPETSTLASRLLATAGRPSGEGARARLDNAAERDADVISALARRNAVLASLVRSDAPIFASEVLAGLRGGAFLSLLEIGGSLWRVWGVNGHRFLPTGGHRISPTAAMFSPHWRPCFSPPRGLAALSSRSPEAVGRRV